MNQEIINKIDEIEKKYKGQFDEKLKEAEKNGKVNPMALRIFLVILAIGLIVQVSLLLSGDFENVATVMVVLLVAFVGLVIVYCKKDKIDKSDIYNAEYCQLVVKEVLGVVFNNIQCEVDPINPNNKVIYDEANFDKKYSIIKFNSAWSMNYGNHVFRIFDVLTEIPSNSKENNYKTLFKGLFGVITLSHNFNCEIIVNSESETHGKSELINIDSLDFDKTFNVYTNNKQAAMQLLTHDVMDKLLNMKNRGFKFEFRIINDKLYCRFDHLSFDNRAVFAVERRMLETHYWSAMVFIELMNIVEKAIYDNSLRD